MRKQRDLRHMLADAETKADVIELLAKFFQDAFTDDPISVDEWLAANQTSTDLFSELVAALRLQNESELVKLTQDNLGDALLEKILMEKYLPKTV
jgi:uncharacterized protein with von Willebrand factor type A (vWA) domain